jgi:glycosyltransferase involved in cell wall biosynthesis
VVIPVFNGERYLSEAIRSLQAQDHKPVEAIVVDDGSVDGTPEVVRAFPGVRLIRQPNQGQGAARNAGLQAALGEYVAFLDHDDVMTPDRIRLQLDPLLRDDGLAGTVGSMQLFREPGAPWPAWAVKGSEDEPEFYPTSLLARASALRAVEGFDARQRIGEDWDLLLRLREAGYRIEVIPNVVVKRRIHGGNLTANEGPTRELLFRMVRSWLASKRARR